MTNQNIYTHDNVMDAFGKELEEEIDSLIAYEEVY